MNRIDLRRRRLLAWAGHGMVMLSAGGLAACGGGGGDGNGVGDLGGGGASGGGIPGAAVSPALRASTLDAVRSTVAGLAAGRASFDSAALARAMQALPGLAKVGISSRMGNGWAQFTDGRFLVVPNNLEPAVPTSGRHAQPLGTARKRKHAAGAGEFDTPSLLVAQQYRQLDTLGQVPLDFSSEAAHLCQDFVSAETLPNLRKMAEGRGFTLPAIQQDEPTEVGIDNGGDELSRVSGDGVFFVTACAAQVGSDDTPRTVICTGTRATEANLARYEDELNAGQLTYAVTLQGVAGAWEPVPSLAIGSEFLSLRWSFPTECIGIFNLTGGASLSDWIDPLNRAGLRHILGWERPVSWQRMLAFADDLIQLNLATNNLDGRGVSQNPEPRLRAYGMGETLEHLMKRGIASDGGTGDALFYLQEQRPELYVNTLLPTIDHVTIREDSLEIELVGQFGHATPGEPPRSAGPSGTLRPAEVVISSRIDAGRFTEPLLQRAADPPLSGFSPLSPPLWEGGLLQTSLQVGELDGGGYVQVFNGGRCSNVVPITHWEIPIRLVTTIDELTLSVTITLHLRADVHGWRLEPEAAERNGILTSPMNSSVHSRADFAASGSISHNEPSTRTTTTISWSGSGGFGNQIGSLLVNLGGTLDWGARRLQNVGVGAQGGAYQQRTVTEQFDVNGALFRRTDQTVGALVNVGAFGPGLQGPLELAFDEQWNLLPGEFDMPPVDDDILPAPPQRVRRTRLNWSQVRPDFPPRNDYGGT